MRRQYFILAYERWIRTQRVAARRVGTLVQRFGMRIVGVMRGRG